MNLNLKKSNKNNSMSTIKVFLIFFGTIVGAGFASGREVYIYFARFGFWGLVMTIVAGITFFLLGYIFLQLGKNCKADSLTDFFKLLFGKFAHIFEIIIIFSYIIVLGAMFAGFDSLQGIIFQNFDFPIISIIGALLCVVTVLGGIDKISKLNGILLPLLLIFLFAIFTVAIFKTSNFNFENIFNFSYSSLLNSIGCCIIFVCSNMFLTGFILMKTGSNTTKNVDKKASVLTGIVLTVITFLSSLSIILNPVSIQYDMPFVYLAFGVSNIFVILSVVILWLAIFTTAVATMFTISWWLNGYINDKHISIAITCLVSFLLSRVGFSVIIDFFYPLTGFMDIVFVICAIVLYKRVNLLNKLSNNSNQIVNNKVCDTRKRK